MQESHLVNYVQIKRAFISSLQFTVLLKQESMSVNHSASGRLLQDEVSSIVHPRADVDLPRVHNIHHSCYVFRVVKSAVRVDNLRLHRVGQKLQDLRLGVFQVIYFSQRTKDKEVDTIFIHLNLVEQDLLEARVIGTESVNSFNLKLRDSHIVLCYHSG